MSSEQIADPAPNQPAKTAAMRRLAELQRALQRTLKRKPTEIERTALQRAALLSLRAEIAAFDPHADSNDVVRLDNAARRARGDFERLAGIDSAHKPKRLSMSDIEREIARHV
jgi:hypothetical protein